jgi:hypothetical protein
VIDATETHAVPDGGAVIAATGAAARGARKVGATATAEPSAALTAIPIATLVRAAGKVAATVVGRARAPGGEPMMAESKPECAVPRCQSRSTRICISCDRPICMHHSTNWPPDVRCSGPTCTRCLIMQAESRRARLRD